MATSRSHINVQAVSSNNFKTNPTIFLAPILLLSMNSYGKEYLFSSWDHLFQLCLLPISCPPPATHWGGREQRRKKKKPPMLCRYCSAAAKHQVVLITNPNQHCMKKFDSITGMHSALSVGIRDEGQKCMFPLTCAQRGFPHGNGGDLLFILSFLSLFTSYTLFFRLFYTRVSLTIKLAPLFQGFSPAEDN